MKNLVPGKTKEAKAAVLMARNSRLPYRKAIRIGASMLAREQRESTPVFPKRSAVVVNRRALNGWQPEPEDAES